jgi:hypothetical protein
MVDGHIDRPMTNYERIKNMSVEEMAEELSHICRNAKRTQKDKQYLCITSECKRCLKQYLESEVETE